MHQIYQIYCYQINDFFIVLSINSYSSSSVSIYSFFVNYCCFLIIIFLAFFKQIKCIIEILKNCRLIFRYQQVIPLYFDSLL